MKKVTYVGTIKGFEIRKTKNKQIAFIVESNGAYHILHKTYDFMKDYETITEENELNTYMVFKCYETKTMTICYNYWHAFYDYKTCELLNYNYEYEHRNKE